MPTILPAGHCSVCFFVNNGDPTTRLRNGLRILRGCGTRWMNRTRTATRVWTAFSALLALSAHISTLTFAHAPLHARLRTHTLHLLPRRNAHGNITPVCARDVLAAYSCTTTLPPFSLLFRYWFLTCHLPLSIYHLLPAFTFSTRTCLYTRLFIPPPYHHHLRFSLLRRIRASGSKHQPATSSFHSSGVCAGGRGIARCRGRDARRCRTRHVACGRGFLI